MRLVGRRRLGRQCAQQWREAVLVVGTACSCYIPRIELSSLPELARHQQFVGLEMVGGKGGEGMPLNVAAVVVCGCPAAKPLSF